METICTTDLASFRSQAISCSGNRSTIPSGDPLAGAMHDRTTGPHPGSGAAGNGDRVDTTVGEEVGGGQAAVAGRADHVHPLVAGKLGAGRGDPAQRYQPGAGYMPADVLVR